MNQNKSLRDLSEIVKIWNIFNWNKNQGDLSVDLTEPDERLGISSTDAGENKSWTAVEEYVCP